MTANDIVGDARVARVRELKAELAAAKARLLEVESEYDALKSHFDLALVALRDFEQLGPEDRLRIIDGWNAILRYRNVAKLTSDDISKLKAAYLADLGIEQPVKGPCGLQAVSSTPPAEGVVRASLPEGGPAINVPLSTLCPQRSTRNAQPATTWIVFDGAEANSYRSGSCRVTYTGGTGPHRADLLILDYVHAVKLLGLDTSCITVETADKALAKKLESFGAVVVSN